MPGVYVLLPSKWNYIFQNGIVFHCVQSVMVCHLVIERYGTAKQKKLGHIYG